MEQDDSVAYRMVFLNSQVCEMVTNVTNVKPVQG